MASTTQLQACGFTAHISALHELHYSSAATDSQRGWFVLQPKEFTTDVEQVDFIHVSVQTAGGCQGTVHPAFHLLAQLDPVPAQRHLVCIDMKPNANKLCNVSECCGLAWLVLRHQEGSRRDRNPSAMTLLRPIHMWHLWLLALAEPHGQVLPAVLLLQP